MPLLFSFLYSVLHFKFNCHFEVISLYYFYLFIFNLYFDLNIICKYKKYVCIYIFFIYRPNSILVYNCSSGSINKVTWGSVERIAIPLILRHPSHDIYRYPNGSFTSSKVWNYMCVMLYHHIPAYCLDLLSVLTGRKPK